MAASLKRACANMDYKQLNSFSSAVLYDSVPKRNKASKFYEVERVITRRRVRYDHEYLIKWRGWSLEFCSWETSTNLTPDLLTSYEKPVVADERLQVASLQFSCGVTSALRSLRSAPVYVNIDLDVWRHTMSGKGVPSEHRGHHLFEKNDFNRFKYLPDNWWYNLDGAGNGISVDFPLKAKPVLSWSPKTFLKKNGGMVEAKRYPIEKVCLTIIRKSCTAEQI